MTENTEHAENPTGEDVQRPPIALRELPALAWDGPVGQWLRARGNEVIDALTEPSRTRMWIVVAASALFVIAGFNMVAWWFGGTDHAIASLLRSLDRTVVGAHLWGLAHVTTHPVASYLRGHTRGLPVAPAVLYAFWQLTGMVTWLLGLRRGAGPRLLWVLFGAATGAMVWAGTPATAQGTAAGVWAMTWGLLALPMLRGLTFRRVINVFVDNHQPQQHVPTGEPAS